MPAQVKNPFRIVSYYTLVTRSFIYIALVLVATFTLEWTDSVQDGFYSGYGGTIVCGLRHRIPDVYSYDLGFHAAEGFYRGISSLYVAMLFWSWIPLVWTTYRCVVAVSAAQMNLKYGFEFSSSQRQRLLTFARTYLITMLGLWIIGIIVDIASVYETKTMCWDRTASKLRVGAVLLFCAPIMCSRTLLARVRELCRSVYGARPFYSQCAASCSHSCGLCTSPSQVVPRHCGLCQLPHYLPPIHSFNAVLPVIPWVDKIRSAFDLRFNSYAVGATLPAQGSTHSLHVPCLCVRTYVRTYP